MHVQLLQLDQSVSLEDTSTSFSVIFQLPNGQLVRASVDNEATQAILECQVENAPPQEEQRAPTPPPARPRFNDNVHQEALSEPNYEPAPEIPSQQAAPSFDPSAPEFNEVDDEDESVNWRQLDDSVLTPKMKNILNAVGLPDEVAVSELKRTVEKIVSKMPKPAVQPPQRAPARQQAKSTVPGVGEVVWHDGPVVIDRPPRRTVPKDSMGYPIVSGGKDPGEVVGRGDLDEDGVASL